MNESALNLVDHVLPDGKRILRFLQRRGVITLVSAPGDGEVTVVSDESMGDKDPLLARLLAAATAGVPPAGPANNPDERGKGLRFVRTASSHAGRLARFRRRPSGGTFKCRCLHSTTMGFP